MIHCWSRWLRVGAALAAAGVAALAAAQPVDVPPLPLAGPYPVACSDVAQDFARIPAGDPPDPWWEGEPRDGSPRYVTDLLSEPAATPVVNVALPDDRELFGPWAGQTLPFALLVCYPTSPANARLDYALPTGRLVRRMQRAGDAPILPDDGRWPLLLFSHGYGGSPLGGEYLSAMSLFASYGYVVAAPFHGDRRFARLSFDNLSDVVFSLANFERYTAMQAIRPLALSATIDRLFDDPAWRDRLDPDRIGGFGASQGGESMMLLAGARLTTSIGLSSRQVVRDERLKAAVGYVPYFGQSILPAFGRENRGTEGITTPFLALSGTADFVAPIEPAQQAMERLAGTRALVALVGVEHGFEAVDAADIFTWSLLFLDALVRDVPESRALLARMRSVTGGTTDVVRLDYVAPRVPALDERITVEYYNASLDHYFITADPAEIAMLDEGIVVPGWRRTGFAFKTWAPTSTQGAPTCRFFGTPFVGPNSHFFTANDAECAWVRTLPAWTFEGLAFRAIDAQVAGCPPNTVEVTRLYNNGMGGQANHRYLTSLSEIASMLERGWVDEGPRLCTPP